MEKSSVTRLLIAFIVIINIYGFSHFSDGGCDGGLCGIYLFVFSIPITVIGLLSMWGANLIFSKYRDSIFWGIILLIVSILISSGMLSFYNDNLDTKELKFLFKLTIAINLILVVFGLNTFFKFNKNESTGRLTTHRWKQTLGRAQMAENSGDIKEAINLYIEAINLLEGDFAYLKDDQAYGRDQRVQEMRLKVNHLSELKKNGKDKI